MAWKGSGVRFPSAPPRCARRRTPASEHHDSGDQRREWDRSSEQVLDDDDGDVVRRRAPTDERVEERVDEFDQAHLWSQMREERHHLFQADGERTVTTFDEP